MYGPLGSPPTPIGGSGDDDPSPPVYISPRDTGCTLYVLAPVIDAARDEQGWCGDGRVYD